MANTNGAGGQSVLVCMIGSHRFALPTAEVVETMRPLPVETVMGAPPLVRGLSVIRGVPAIVIDSALLFGETAESCGRLVTARAGDRTVAFTADAVLGLEVIAQSELERMPPLIGADDAIAAMASRDPGLVFLLNTARIVPDDFSVPGNGGRAAS